MAIALLLTALAPGRSRADMVSPARLELNEIEPGQFDVLFTLPVMEGRKLRAVPILPDVCQDLAEHDVQFTPFSFVETWTTACELEALQGQIIEIRGLLGTSVDVFLRISTLEGRSYDTILRPGRPWYRVPERPSLLEVAEEILRTGARSIVARPEWWLLLLVLAVSGATIRAQIGGVLALLTGQVLAIAAAAASWLIVPDWLPALAVGLTAAVTSLDLANGTAPPRLGWLHPVWPALLGLGLLLGGATGTFAPVQGLSDVEERWATLALALGTGAGLVLLLAIAAMTRGLLERLHPPSSAAWPRVAAAYGLGTVTWTLLLMHVWELVLRPERLDSFPASLLAIAGLAGIWSARLGRLPAPASVLGFLFLSAAGLGLASTGLRLGERSFLVTGSLFAAALLVALPSMRGRSWAGALIVSGAVFVHALQRGGTVQSELSYPVGNTVGAGLLATCLFYASYRWARGFVSRPIGRALRATACLLAIVALGIRLLDYEIWLRGPLAMEWALGSMPIPLLSLLLVLFAILVRPRRRLVLEQLGVRRRGLHRPLSSVVLAFFLLPQGNVHLRNPWFDPSSLDTRDVERIMTGILQNTYQAFNLDDEQRLYDQLAQSVSEELIADIYLDSRRSLTAGTRKGASVSVKDVSVLSIDDPTGGTDPQRGLAYECSWMVTARVQHLQHVHHRKNIYRGLLTIRVVENRWTLAGVELRSEERVVIPWRSG
jgi:hypothetical protein